MKPEIIDTCPKHADVNNNVSDTHTTDKSVAQVDIQNKHKRSSLRYLNVTTEDLMNGNFNVLVQRNVGSGYGGSVYKCLVYDETLSRHRSSSSGSATGWEGTGVIALKVLSKDRTKAKVAVNEVELLRAASGRNVLGYLTSMETVDAYWIFTEFCAKGDLHGMLRSLDHRNILTRDYMRDVISGLQSLHDKFIAHADIKMKNILITDKNVAKIADFGFARQYISGQALESVCNGTRDYWAPEMMEVAPTYSPFRADIYALGVTFAGVCERRPIKQKHDNIHYVVSKFRDNRQVELFRGLLSPHTERWSLQRAAASDWINEFASPPSSPV